MPSKVKNFSVGYNPINKSNVFNRGDCITGQITFELTNECKIVSLCVKLKGKAEVKWTEHNANIKKTYHAKEKYFSIKQFLIPEGQDSNVTRGSHVYPFTFQIPAKDLPSSFKGSHGVIKYTLEANLIKSRLVSMAKAKFTLVRNANLNSDPLLMTPQHNITVKKMKLFTSGTVGMDVNIERTGFHQELFLVWYDQQFMVADEQTLLSQYADLKNDMRDNSREGIKVVTSIHNTSSRDIKPKYCLYAKYSYFAQGERKVETKDILKEVGDPIPPSAGRTVTKTITIPPTMCVSVLNCNILKVEYRLRVYLDVKYASDPEIKFPIVILPALQGPDGENLPAPPSYGFGAFASSDMPGGTSFLQNPTASGPSTPPPSYETYQMYPSLPNFNRKS